MDNSFSEILKFEIDELAADLEKIDYNSLSISEYNKSYIQNIKPFLKYHLEIYASCIKEGLRNINLALTDITLADYGGGSGFLSILAKRIGFKNVIYIDLNPKSVHTINLLKDKIGIGPDIILQGNSQELKKWCADNNICPNLLIATDLIEHVYDLNTFFDELAYIGNMQMVFSTGSNPYNPVVKKRLRKYMIGCETGSMENPNYYTLRHQYIKENFPHLSSEMMICFAKQTRGLIYSDIESFVNENSKPISIDDYNTCDPQTGNWVERILPVKDYKNILSRHNYKVKVKKVLYNTKRRNAILSFVFKMLNVAILLSGNLGLFISPIILLSCKTSTVIDCVDNEKRKIK